MSVGTSESAGTILVVDDDEATRRSAARILQEAGHRVLQAPDAYAALELIERRDSGVDLVVADVFMPGIGGDELADRVWDRSSIPVLLMSGAADRGLDREAQRGPSDFLLKPLKAQALLDKVAALLNHAALRRARAGRLGLWRERVRRRRSALGAGPTLPMREFQRRHAIVVRVLWCHAVLLGIAGAIATGDPLHGALLGAILVPFARLARSDRLGRAARQLLATLGLLTASALIVQLTHGSIEAQSHPFLVVALIAVYEECALFGVAVAYVLLGHLAASAFGLATVFAPGGAGWAWTGVHCLAIALLGAICVLGRRFNEDLREAEANARQRLAHRALHDHLTGLPNRRQLVEDVQSTADGRPSAVLFIDLDDFKAINEAYSHAAGDRLLIDVAQRLRHCSRGGDVVARSGGDEFVIVARDVEDEGQASAFAARVLDTIDAPFEIDGVLRRVNVSVGVSMLAGAGGSITEALARADAAMYAAKANGRGRACFADEAITASENRRAQVQEALQACDPSDFELYYQPIVSLADGRLHAVEALLRWTHPTLGPISPAEFIPLAERSGRIMDLGRWVLDRACRDSLRWEAQRGRPLLVFTNVSATQVTHPTFAGMVERTLRATGATGRNIALEMTETAAVDNAAAAVANFTALRALGVDLILDDFGTGQSSLSQLAGLPFSLIKLDRSFVADPSDAQRMSMLGMVVRLGEGLGIPTLAEGIETREVLASVRAAGFGYAQGYLFARPQPAHELERLLLDDRPFADFVPAATEVA